MGFSSKLSSFNCHN